MQNTIIHILGFQGTGKSTIAKAICEQADVKLVDNHSVFAPVMNLIEEDGITPLPQAVWDNIGKIWESVRDTITHISPKTHNFVITNNLRNNIETHIECTQQWQSSASFRKGIYVPIRLIIDVKENERRIIIPDRITRHKEINPLTPQDNANNYSVLNTNHPHELTLDVTNLSAENAAKAILNHVSSLSV